jgi:hypothetical protein
MKFFLEDFNAKLGREDIFRPSIENENLHQYTDDNDVRIVKFATPKNLVVRARCSRTETFINTPGRLLIGGFTTRYITY